MDDRISAYLVKLRRHHPFFATLSLYIDYQFTEQIDHFDAAGSKVRLNPNYFSKINNGERAGVLLHLTLHCALLHETRCGPRIPEIWNIAADIVVNQMIVDSSFTPPPGTATEPRYAKFSVEFIYTKLLERAKSLADAMKESVTTANAASTNTQQSHCDKNNTSQTVESTEENSDQPETNNQYSESEWIKALQVMYPTIYDIQKSQSNSNLIEQNKTETYWKNALRCARAVERMSTQTQGLLPDGANRAIDEILCPQLDWRTVLWRFMSKTPCDYNGFDRRFIHQHLYLDQLEGESLKVHIAVDTSGSIGDTQLAQFRAEIETIVRCYSGIKGQLYFVDAEVYGPYQLTHDMQVVTAEGGGGTDFRVFFQTLEEQTDPFEQALCIYLTDGYGDFPDKPPAIPMLWVATDDAIDHFPFGEVTRLI